MDISLSNPSCIISIPITYMASRLNGNFKFTLMLRYHLFWRVSFHLPFLGGLLADYKMEAQLIIPPVIGGLPCHCWPSIPCSPASEFHWCWISKALSKSPRYKEKKTSKLYNVGWKLHHSSMCMSIPHLKNWWISFQPGKSTGLMTFPRLHVLNSTKLVGGGLADFRMTKIRFHHD